ncbi:MAG: hypothetical protein IKX21_07555 [Deltaproteobacteria bacterium]|nr:hypothetical protein [Deltaproteobacteria bacterium]
MSEIIDSLRADLEALHKIGAVDEAALHEFDAICQQQQRASKARRFRMWLVWIFLALLVLDGVLVLCGVEYVTLAVFHVFAGFFPVFAVTYFEWFKSGLKLRRLGLGWKPPTAEDRERMRRILPWWLFCFANCVPSFVFGELHSRAQEQSRAAEPPALTCPAPAASAAPASAAAAAQTN